jgi:hypothetical protein
MRRLTTGIRSPVGAGMFIFFATSRRLLDPIQLPVYWIPRTTFRVGEAAGV